MSATWELNGFHLSLKAESDKEPITVESEHDHWLDTLASLGLLCDQPDLADPIGCPRPQPDDGKLYLSLSKSIRLRRAVDCLAEQATERCRQLARLLADLEAQRARTAALDRALRSLGLRQPAELDGALADLLAISDAYAAAVPVLDAAKAAVFDDEADVVQANNFNGAIKNGRVAPQQQHSNAALLAELERRRRQRRRQRQRQQQQRRKRSGSVGDSVDGARRWHGSCESALNVALAPPWESTMSPAEAGEFARHFARLFVVPTALPACHARLSLLHRRISECDSLMANLRDILRLPGAASSRAVVAAVERLASARQAEARDCLAELLGPDEASGLARRLAEYDRFFGQFNGLVGDLRAELGVARMSHILPAVRACVQAARANGWDGGSDDGASAKREVLNAN